MPKLYKVGGCVRDKLLGTPTKDIDFTFVLDNIHQSVDAGFLEMKTWMENEGFTIFLSVPEMYTIRAKFPKGHKFQGLDADFVLARKEIGYEPDSRRPVLLLGELEDDLIRRDFTINAMAEDENGGITDLFGGQRDLKRKVLNSPQDPERMFLDDPLRVFRALRFSVTKDMQISSSLEKAMKNPEIMEKMKKTVSMERVQSEVNRMMQFDSVKTLKMLSSYDIFTIPGLMDFIFSNGWWMKMTNEKKK